MLELQERPKHKAPRSLIPDVPRLYVTQNLPDRRCTGPDEEATDAEVWIKK